MVKRISGLALLAAGAFAAAACSVALTAGADFDPNVDFDRYHTFAWDEADELPTGDPRLDDNPFFVQRLHTTIQARLGERRIRYSADNPDLLVHHHATVRDRVEVIAADRERGYEPTASGEGAEVIQWEEGTILVDIADAETRQIVWRGWAMADVEQALNDPVKMTELVYDAVAKMFELFPPSLLPDR
jgi:hypothetical protein